MFQEILPILCCPSCHRKLHLQKEKWEYEEIVSGELVCSCGNQYLIRDGIADFGSHEQENINSWSEYYQQDSYEELDQKMEAHKSKTQQRIEQKFLHAITNETSKLEKGVLLDIASGRGILLQELLKTTNSDVHIIAADLSFQVLKYDRMKLKMQEPERHISFIACDATKLPIQTGTVDMVSTFVGFVNMGSLAESGIKDTARVLKPQAKLVNSCIYLHEDTPGFQNLRQFFLENGVAGAESFLLKQEVEEIHRRYFSNVSAQIVYEGIAEPSKDDLIPCAGEWFADTVVTAIK